MKIKTFTNEENFILETVKFVEDINPETIALSGGNTPKPIYQALANTEIADREFFIVDERYIPSDDPNSNQKMIHETLNPDHFHHFSTNLTIDESLEKYAKELPDKFDLVILGIGPDGHTASLFPNSPALEESKYKTAHTETLEFTVKDRLTLTFPAILNSKNILILLKGKEKQTILNKLQDPNYSSQELPAKKLLEHQRLTIHFCNC